MNFDNLTFGTSTVDGDMQCTNITILNDEIFELLQVIVITVGESYPQGIERDEFLKLKIIDDGRSICMFSVNRELN